MENLTLPPEQGYIRGAIQNSRQPVPTDPRKQLELLHISTARHEPDRSPHDRFHYLQLLVISRGVYCDVFLY